MKNLVVIACLAVLLVPFAASGDLWDVNRDFSGTQNPNGAWSYGWRMGPASPLTLYTDTSQWPYCPPDPNVHHWQLHIDPEVAQNANDHVWSCNGCDYPPSTTWFHPGQHGEQSVVRWTAPEAGRFLVNAGFLALDTGSTIVHVYVNGSDVFTATLWNFGAAADTSFSMNCHVGDLVELGVDAISFTDDSVGIEFAIAPPTGACCFPSGACLVGTPDDCAAAGGTYRGDGVPCDEGICTATPVAHPTWGAVKMIYR